MKPPAEFVLVAACCIWPHSQKRADAIRTAAGSGVDWARLLRASRRQRVEALVLDGLRQAGIAVPTKVIEALAVQASQIGRRNSALAAESLRLQKQFDDAGIPNLILKGVTLSVLAYDNVFVKSAWDIDLLVSPGDTVRGMAALEAAGYVRIDPKGLTEAQLRTYLAMARECIFVKDRIFVEIQWRLSDNSELLKGVSAFTATQQVPLGAQQFLRTLGRDELFAYLCVHGASHCWARLKWIADLGALLARESLDERQRLYRVAEAFGAGPSAAQALLLCHNLVGTDLPPALVRELDSDWRVHCLVAAAMRAMLGGPNERAINPGLLLKSSTALAHFLMGRGWRFLAVEMRNQWVSLHDHVHIPLPRWAHFLYPVIRLPLFFWRRLYGAD